MFLTAIISITSVYISIYLIKILIKVLCLICDLPWYFDQTPYFLWISPEFCGYLQIIPLHPIEFCCKWKTSEGWIWAGESYIPSLPLPLNSAADREVTASQYQVCTHRWMPFPLTVSHHRVYKLKPVLKCASSRLQCPCRLYSACWLSHLSVFEYLKAAFPL